jgi:hypothetical protein
LIAFFSIFFGFQLDLFVGLGVGYLKSYGYLGIFEMSSAKAKIWEGRFPFNKQAQKPEFVTVDGSMGGGSSLPTFVRSASQPQ